MADISVAGEELQAVAPRSAGPFSRLSAALAAEDERRILWAPVWFGSGIAIYFTLLAEPPLWLGLAAFVAAATIAVLIRRRRVCGATPCCAWRWPPAGLPWSPRPHASGPRRCSTTGSVRPS